MTKWTTVFFISLCICLSSIPCRAERAYVTNPTKINLRNAPGNNEKILAILPQNEAVEILDSQKGWSQVRLLAPKWNNKSGWILSDYLETRVPWEMQATALKDENVRLKEKLAKVETEWGELTAERKELTGKLEENKRALAEIQENYQSLKEGSGQYLQLKEDYEIAQKRMEDAIETAEKLSKENGELKSSHRNTWFLTGGAVMLVGLIFGLTLGRREKRRKSTYY